MEESSGSASAATSTVSNDMADDGDRERIINELEIEDQSTDSEVILLNISHFLADDRSLIIMCKFVQYTVIPRSLIYRPPTFRAFFFPQIAREIGT